MHSYIQKEIGGEQIMKKYIVPEAELVELKINERIATLPDCVIGSEPINVPPWVEVTRDDAVS